MGRVEGKVALITGAARGQGRSHAIRLAQEGADIIGVDVCADIPTITYPGPTVADLEETERLVTELGRRMVSHVVDVRDRDGLAEAAADGAAQLGRLDIVSANAGIAAIGEAGEITPTQWSEMMEINIDGVWNTASAALPILRKQGEGGSIVITSSVGGLRGYPGCSHYVTTKHAVVGLMKSLAVELAPEMIRVNSVHPTNVLTPMINNEATFRRMRPDLENPTLEDATEVFASINAMPLPWVESVDISNAVLFLASDEARYVTGIALPIDMGATAGV
ncbi:MAG: mycofactocin-coupled SDR family oxidoreductase [Acidimicrobiales bacterium]